MSANVTARQVGRFLEERARKAGKEAVIFYNDIAAHFAMPEVDERWQQHPLCKLFDVLDHEDARERRPFRTALVVSREKNMPGQGFFKTAASLRSPCPRIETELERMKF